MKLVPLEDVPKKTSPVEDLDEAIFICDEMVQLCTSSNGIGLSAVQVGIPLKLFVVRANEDRWFAKQGEYGFFMNMEYSGEPDKGLRLSVEGCLSILNKRFVVPRYRSILIDGYQLMRDRRMKLRNMSVPDIEQGIVFQHEADHHNNILISDLGLPVG